MSLAMADSILGRQHFYYASLGKRDPFASLLAGHFEESGPDGLVNIDEVKLVGVMWGDTDRFALVEDADGYSYILREGDRVKYGTVTRLDEDRLVARINFFGMTRTVVLSLEKE
jgi:Tfp pilus assembly protein PilP